MATFYSRRIFFLLAAALFSESYVHAQQSREWSYGEKGVANWSIKFEYCRGSRQSPIDLTDAKIVKYSTSDELRFSGYGQEISGILQNIGHTVELKFPNKSDLMVSGGGLPGQYRLLQLHFHWGSPEKQNQGSEHSIGGKFFPLAMHLVHINSKYKSITNAVKDPSGLAVLGVMFATRDADNTALNPIIDAIIDLPNGNYTEIKLSNLFQTFPEDRTDFYRYEGSFTTPTCNEAVVWTVFNDTVPIGRNQISKFYQIKATESNYLLNNYRPIQPINGRSIQFYHHKTSISVEDDSHGSKPIAVVVIVVIIGAIAIVAVSIGGFICYRNRTRELRGDSGDGAEAEPAIRNT